MEKKNSVLSLLKVPFHRRTLEEKLRVKELGPDQPVLNIREHIHDRTRSYTRSFSASWYEKKVWLTASNETRAMFCFPCLLFQVPGTDQAWIEAGITTIKHFYEKANKHEQTKSHIENAMRLALFGNASMSVQLSECYRTAIRRHNEEVDKNRHTLSKVIDCFKSCGAFEGALRGHDESALLESSGVSKGLSDLVASLNAAVREHAQTVPVFNGTSTETVQNELLDCMLSVAREQLMDEIRSADFISVIVETSDISAQSQFVIVIRYIDKAHNVQERFFEFVSLQNATADFIATALLERLSSIIPAEHKTKLISQSYDGASAMTDATGGVHKKVQAVYENAHHVHCYAHHMNLVMQKVTSHMTQVRQFFSDVTGLSGFFSRSPKRTGVLDKVVVHRLPRSSAARRNFHSRAINTVYEHKDDLLQCFENIRDSDDFDPASIREAGGFLRLLEDDTFSFFLELFHLIMPHVDVLYSEFQKCSIDMIFIASAMKEFIDNVQKIRESLPGLCDAQDSNLQQQQRAKRRCTRGPGELQTLATEVCDTVLAHMMERFAFTEHLISATLLDVDKFEEYTKEFPDTALNSAAEAYPLLNKSKLKTELSLIYSNDELRKSPGVVALFHLFQQNDLQGVFTETVALLKILITTPMTTAESERCFSTLTRTKIFLRNCMSQGRLNALAMLSIENTLVRDIPDFNKRVIEKFICLKDRREKLTYTK